MARRRKDSGAKQDRRLLEAGVKLMALGGGFVLLPMFLASSPLGNTLRSAGTFGWWMLGLGAVLLGLGLLLGRRRAPVLVAVAQAPADTLPRSTTTFVRRQAPAAPAVPTPQKDAIPVAAQPVRPEAWSKAVFDLIEWRRFEAVVEKLMQQGGFSTRAQSHGADGGVDIWVLSRQDASAPISLVQCKHWHDRRVGVDKIRELRGVMAAHQVRNGQFATTSTFTPDSTAFARDNGVGLLDVDALLALIAQRTPAQQAELLAVALDGDYWRPTCASCGVKMVERAPRKGGSGFWGV